MCGARGHLGRIQGGETGKSPQRALTIEPTLESAQMTVAQQVARLFARGGVVRSLRDRHGYRSELTPSLLQKSAATPHIVVLKPLLVSPSDVRRSMVDVGRSRGPLRDGALCRSRMGSRLAKAFGVARVVKARASLHLPWVPAALHRSASTSDHSAKRTATFAF